MDFDTNNKIPATEVLTEESTKPQIDTIDQTITTATHGSTSVEEQPVESHSTIIEQDIEQDLEQVIEQDMKDLDAYSQLQNSENVHGDDTFEDVLDDIKSEYVSSQQEIIQTEITTRSRR